MNRVLELACASAVLTSAVLLYTAPTYDLGIQKPQTRLASTDAKAILKTMNDAKINWCERSRACSKMAEALYFEGRGEGKKGMHAIANVIVNRSVKNKRNIYAVITRPHQFSYLFRESLEILDGDSYRTAQLLSVKALNGELPDITNGSTHYVAPKRLKRVPSWVKKLEKTVAINDHQFFRG